MNLLLLMVAFMITDLSNDYCKQRDRNVSMQVYKPVYSKVASLMLVLRDTASLLTEPLKFPTSLTL